MSASYSPRIRVELLSLSRSEGTLSKNKTVQRPGVLILSFPEVDSRKECFGFYLVFGDVWLSFQAPLHLTPPPFSKTANITEFILAFKLGPTYCLDSPNFTTR